MQLKLPSLVWLAILAGVSAENLALAADRKIDFNRDLRPIFSDSCFQCHGPDKGQRKADLRLDEAPPDDRDGGPVVVPGKPEESELLRRITSTDDAERMPPPKTGAKLTDAQIETIRRWIAEGGAWEKHWALIPPKRPSLPSARNKNWAKNPIDLFVLKRLEGLNERSDGVQLRPALLAPAPAASKEKLLRRITLDLTGVPPTLAELDAFLGDESPDAYERAVDRLLDSPRFGERMAWRWLDGARYADTSGYQSDGERFMWRWRDWVIDAYNRNLPFDQFTVEQIAGDLLRNPTLEQLIATGFNRNHRGNAEGGIIPEEYAVEYVADRVETTSTVWLGMTMMCARCHDHKFDPTTQQDFYRLFAFFNNVPERGRAIKFGNSPPFIASPTQSQQEELGRLDRRIEAARESAAKLEAEVAQRQAEWEAGFDASKRSQWFPSDGLAAAFAFDGASEMLESKARHGVPARIAGPSAGAISLDGKAFLDAGNVADFGFYDKLSIAAFARITPGGGGTVCSRMTDDEKADGYYLVIEDGKVKLNLVKRWLDDSLRVETAARIGPNSWHHVLATYDGSRVADGVKLYVDGRLVDKHVALDELNQTFQTKEPLRIGGGNGPRGRFRGDLDEVRIYDRVLTDDDAAMLAAAGSLGQIVRKPAGERTSAESIKLRAAFLEQGAPAAIADAFRDLCELERDRARLIESFPTTMVMQELPRPRLAHILLRGQYDRPGTQVDPGVPAVLPPISGTDKPNRLDLAKWLVDKRNPATARVTVNRLWQMLFGVGLVKTTDDFGARGEWPSHPELLDWLAVEFMESGWNVKRLVRTIATSATYRQSSAATPAQLARDPENRLLARGPRLRFSAEMVRDHALAASGLLVEQLGGPSVKPYQPDGLWKDLTGTEEYQQDHGAGLYRRSLYTFWKRTVAPPMMATFDAAGRETCTVRESRTNTPLQSLALMNDVTFIEAARALAERMMLESSESTSDRLEFGFRTVTSRRPSVKELEVISRAFECALSEYSADRAGAAALLEIGEHASPANLDPIQLAAYTSVASLLLNLDEAITKE